MEEEEEITCKEKNTRKEEKTPKVEKVVEEQPNQQEVPRLNLKKLEETPRSIMSTTELYKRPVAPIQLKKVKTVQEFRVPYNKPYAFFCGLALMN